MLEKKQSLREALKEQRRCCITKGGQGGVGGMKKGRGRPQRQESKDKPVVKRKSKNSSQISAKWAAQVESWVTEKETTKVLQPEGICWRSYSSETAKRTIKGGTAVDAKGTAGQEWVVVMSSRKRQQSAPEWLPGLNIPKVGSGAAGLGESRCCLRRRRNRETVISGFAELSFSTEFRVQNWREWKLLTLLNLISCMTKL